MKPAIWRTPLAALTLIIAPPAHAQVLVHDPSAVSQLITQAQTAISQLEKLREQVTQAERLYGSLNQASDVNKLAQQLLTPELRRFLPDIDKLHAAADGDLGALGDLAARAQAIRAAHRLYTPSDPTNDPTGLEKSGARAARDMVIGEQVAEVAAERSDGLSELREALDTASNARAVMDIGARVAAEQALIQNDQMRLQGLQLAQAAEERLERQRMREAAILASHARMAWAKRSFERQ